MGSHSTQTNSQVNKEDITNVGYQDNKSHTQGTWNLGQDVHIVQNAESVGGSLLKVGNFANAGRTCLGIGCTGVGPRPQNPDPMSDVTMKLVMLM